MIFRCTASSILRSSLASRLNKKAGAEKTRRRLFLEGLERRDLLAGVTTDKLDYHPADTALITASGYEVGEHVQFQVVHTDGTPNTGNGHEPWVVQDGGPQDLDGLRDGNIKTSWYVDPDDSLGAIFQLSALGLSSGLYDTHVFTDAIKVDLDQWANDDVAWQNGNINENNATYAEGDVVPFHYVISGLTAGHSYSIGIEWDTTENSGAHAYDYITDYNETESDPPTNPLLNTSGNLIPNVPAGTDFFPIPIDEHVTRGPDGLLGTADDILQLPGSFKVYGGDMTNVSTDYVFSGTYTNGVGYVGATKTGLIITFTAGGVGNDVTTVIAWGGHISARAEWQPEPTASNISGSPYHMRSSNLLRDNTTGDTQNLGQQDRSLSAAAVVTPGTITVIKDVTGGEDPQDFNFSITAAVNPQPIPASIILDDDSGSVTPNSQSFSLSNFTNYTISETVLAGWTTSITLTGPSGTTTVNSNSTTINLAEGTNWTVTFNNVKLNPALDIVKDATVPGGTANIAGEVISYAIAVQNTGNQTLTGVTVVDPFVSNLTRIADLVGDNDNLLEVGETWRFTASHIVTQAEIDAGTNIVNVATADSNETLPDSDDASIPVTQNPALNILKDATVPGSTADIAGELISYTIFVQNTGNQTLTGVTVVDPFVSNLTRIADQIGDSDNLLEVGETWRFTASHIVTQAEIDAGTNIVNVATADSNETLPDSDDASIPVTQNPALNILKDATVPGSTADIAGELISYTIFVQNTGNQTLTGVIVVDPFVSNLTRIADLLGDNDNLLEVGETWAFTATHVVTQAEIDAGQNIVNVATADSNETLPDSDDASVPVTQNPALNILKNATVPGGTADVAGEIISYTISVQNTGNQTLTGVIVVDPFVSNLTRIADQIGDNDNLLEVGETWRFTATHTVTQAEVDAGQNIVNVATADSNETQPDTDDASVPVAQTAALDIVKDATVPGGTADIAGELISYAIFVQNTGNQTLTGVTVVDPFVSNLTRIGDQVGDNDNLLEVGETWRFTASHIVTQAEIDAGTNIVNIATADSNETLPDSDDASIPVTQNPALNILKDATVPGSTADIAGELISYTIFVQNTGNQTLTGVTVVDPFVSNLTRIADQIGDSDNLLEVGETWRFTASHIVTQAEIDAGTNIVNVATADSNETLPDSDDASIPVTQNPALNILKDATVPGSTADIAGELISYTILVQNTGNQTLTGVTVVDPFVSNLTRIGDQVGDNDNLLEVGETWRFTASHTVTQAEIDAGTNIVNVATADSNETLPDSDDASIPVTQNPALNILKDATVPGSTADIAGELISYTILVQNTGNQTLTGVIVVDPFVSNLTRIADLLGDNDNLLEVGETWAFTATHVVTQAEIDAGQNIVNIATADSNETLPDSDDASVPVTQNPALNILKNATVPGGTADVAGEIISYTISVQNTGNQTLTGVIVVDPFVSNLTRIADQIGDNDNLLEVGETWRFTATHTVTQAEVDAGQNIVNIATADSNETQLDTDDASVPVAQTAALDIVKDATVPGGTADIAGELISYAIFVQNTGNQTLTGVTVVDPFVSNLTRIGDQVGDNDNLLEVGETWRFTASHAVTQAEIDAGTNIVNIATADSNETLPDSDDASIPVTQNPALNILKDATVPGGTADIAGELISYTIAVQNTGNQTLTGVTVVDPFVSNLTRIADPLGDNDNLLEVGETWAFTATHVVTQAEIDAGTNIVNVATADSNETLPDSDDASIPVTQNAALNILKDATVPGSTADIAGEVISYAIFVQNTGNLTLTSVTVVDPFVSNLTRIADLLGDNDNLLEVGETWAFTATHVVTQAEIDAGTNILNIATADSNQTPPDSDDASVPVTRRPGLNIVKDATVPGGTADVAGEVITYTIAVQNTGNMTLTGERVEDPFVNNLTRLADLVGDNDNLFEVGEIWLFTATHVVTQAEIDAGINIVNVATARSNETPLTSDDATIPVTRIATLDLVKYTNGQDANTAPGPGLQVGSTATFTYTVANAGNMTLANVSLVDDNGTPGNAADDFHPAFTGGDLNGNNLLDIGETWSFTGSRIVTPGQYTNIATVTASDLTGVTATDSDASSHFGRSQIIVVTPDKGNQSQPFVHIVNASTGEVVTRFLAYEQGYRGGVRVATGDLNGDGIDEIITTPGRSLAPQVKIFDQQGNLLHSFLAFPGKFKGGVDVAVGDVNGDGQNDVVAAMTYNGSQVKVFRNVSSESSLGFSTFTTFNPLGTFKGGATVEVASLGTAFKAGAVTKLNNVVDARSEIIVASGSGMRSTVKVFAFTGSSKTPAAVRTFLPLTAGFKGGITLDVACVNADAVPDIIVAAGNGGSSQVRVLNGVNGAILSAFNAHNDASRNAPVHVAAIDETGDGIADFVYTAQGTDGATRIIRKFDALTAALVDEVMESHLDFGGAYFLETLLSQSQISS